MNKKEIGWDVFKKELIKLLEKDPKCSIKGSKLLNYINKVEEITDGNIIEEVKTNEITI